MLNISAQLSEYIESRTGLNRLMNSLKEKYIATSKFSGTVTLNNISYEESLHIGNLLGRQISVNSTLKTSFKEITKKINEGKYSGFDWLSLFKYYYGENIVTKKELKLQNLNDEDMFFQLWNEENKDRIYIEEVNRIIKENTSFNKIIKQRYHKDKVLLRKDLNNILILLDNIPTIPTPLAVYSSLTGNPHYLDLNKSTSNLFIKFLSIIKNIEYDDDIQTKINILQEINVYTDPISNYVITYKLMGNDILDELSKKNEIVNLNLLNINNLVTLTTENKKIYIFENPSILNSLKYLNVPMIITSGMPNISLYQLLSKISIDNEIYYNGDFDPEGLLIAQKLKEKFPNIKLFCYDLVDYNNSLSSEIISDSRLKKLGNVKDEKLQIIKNKLIESKLSAYQEQNIDRIEKYITN